MSVLALWRGTTKRNAINVTGIGEAVREERLLLVYILLL